MSDITPGVPGARAVPLFDPRPDGTVGQEIPGLSGDVLLPPGALIELPRPDGVEVVAHSVCALRDVPCGPGCTVAPLDVPGAAWAATVYGEPAAITVTVRGRPAPQGSKSFKGRGTSGKGVMVESSKHVKPWRTDVKGAAIDEIERLGRWHLLDGPLSVSMVFTFPRPKGHFGTGRNAGVVKASAPARPATTPDLSKLVRSTEDALTQVVWVDDARVVEYVRLGKWYAGDLAPDVLAQGSGCVIRVWTAGAQ